MLSDAPKKTNFIASITNSAVLAKVNFWQVFPFGKEFVINTIFINGTSNATYNFQKKTGAEVNAVNVAQVPFISNNFANTGIALAPAASQSALSAANVDNSVAFTLFSIIYVANTFIALENLNILIPATLNIVGGIVETFCITTVETNVQGSISMLISQ